MNRRFLNRREFSARCAAFGLSLPLADAAYALQGSAQVLTATGASPAAGHEVHLPDGTAVPALGQGAWHLGQGRHPPAVEEEAIRTGVSLGMTLIDTSGNYGDGRSEQFLGRAIAGQRDRIFLVSKVEADEYWRCHRPCLRGKPHPARHELSRSVSTALAGPEPAIFRRGGGIRTTARGGEDSRLGRVQFRPRPDGRSVSGPGRPSLRHQSGSLQPLRSPHRA